MPFELGVVRTRRKPVGVSLIITVLSFALGEAVVVGVGVGVMDKTASLAET